MLVAVVLATASAHVSLPDARHTQTHPHSTNIIYCICTSEKCISNKLSQYLVHVCMYVVVYWCLVWCLVWCIFCSEAQLMGSGGEEQTVAAATVQDTDPPAGIYLIQPLVTLVVFVQAGKSISNK